jgi:hypothetical protein
MSNFLILSIVFLVGCAELRGPRQAVLTDLKTGQTCKGGFNLLTQDSWVVLPEGLRLEGHKIFARNDSRGVILAGGFVAGGTFFPVYSPSMPTKSEGWALLKSQDGKKIMQIYLQSDAFVSTGYGEATLNDGRKFAVQF